MSTGAWVRSVKSDAAPRPAPLWVWGVAFALAVAAGFAISKPVLAIAVLGGAGIVALVRHIFLRPHDGFLYALVLFPFYTLIRGIVLAYQIPIPMALVGMWPEVLLSVMMASILCTRIRSRQKLRVTWDDVPVIILLVSNLYGVLLSVLQKDAVAVVYGFHQSVTALLFYFVARWLPFSPTYLTRLIRTWLVSFCIFAFFSFIDYALRPNFVIRIVVAMRPGFNGPFDPYDFYKWYPRMQSLLFAEQVWGTVCVFVVLYALTALLEKRPLKNRILLWTTYLLSLTGLLCSMSRGAFVCFAVAVAGLLCFRGPHRRALAATVLVMCVVSGLAWAQFGNDGRIQSLTKRTGALLSAATGGTGKVLRDNGQVDQESSATNRVWQWERALASFPMYPAGRGLGRAGSASVMHNTSVDVNDAVSDGGYFRILAEVGVPGIVCFVIGVAGVMGVLLGRLLRDRRNVTGEERTVALMLFAFLCGLIVHNVGGNAFDFYYIIPLAWFLFGLLLSRREATIAAYRRALIARIKGPAISAGSVDIDMGATRRV